MASNEEHNLEQEIRSKLINLYDDCDSFESLDGDSVSSILFELKEISQHFSDKKFHAKGGVKQICRVRDLRTNRMIAMAELKPHGRHSDPDVERFLREARITAALEHPNIVPIYEIDVNEWDKPFFTMKYLKDQSLGKIVKELSKANPAYIQKYSLNTLLNIFLKVCDAVAFAHSCHVIHLDLKPENIMIGDYGEVYVCDWGLAKLLDSKKDRDTATIELDFDQLDDITLFGEVHGTPGYMAPEQVDTNIAPMREQTDIYSLGAILYTILAYKKPFAGLNVEDILAQTLKGVKREPSSIRAQVPRSLNAVTCKAMSLKQNDRYNSVEEMVIDIRAYQEGFATDAESSSFFKPLWLLIRRHQAISITLGLSLTAIIIIISLFIVQLQNEKLAAENTKRQLEQESQRRQEVSLNLSSAFLKQAEKLLEKNDFDEAFKKLDEVESITPNNSAALGLTIIKEIGRQNLERTIFYLEKAKLNKYEKLRRVVNKFRFKQYRGRLPVGHFINFCKELINIGERKAALYLTSQTIRKGYSVEERFQIAESLLTLENGTLDFFNYRVLPDQKSCTLSLAGNSQLQNIDFLVCLQLSALNLENTAISDLSALRNISIKSLNLSNTNVNSLEDVSGLPLESIDLRGLLINDFTPLKTTPLREIYFSKVNFINIATLTACKELERIFIPQGAYNTLYFSEISQKVDLYLY